MKSATLEELKAMRKRGEIRPEADNAPSYPAPEGFWEEAVPLSRLHEKTPVSLRVDRDVLDWFKAQGSGHLTRMNMVLRAFYEAHRSREAASTDDIPPEPPLAGRSA
jgi:uncharacterized protein (DUF4415 family)